MTRERAQEWLDYLMTVKPGERLRRDLVDYINDHRPYYGFIFIASPDGKFISLEYLRKMVKALVLRSRPHIPPCDGDGLLLLEAF